MDLMKEKNKPGKLRGYYGLFTRILILVFGKLKETFEGEQL